MTPRELRLRERIDTLLDERDKLATRVRRLELVSNNRRGQVRRRDSWLAKLDAVVGENRLLKAQLHFAEKRAETAAAHLTATKIELDRLKRLRRKAAA